MAKKQPQKPLVIAVIGPTSSGKTAFSIELAKAINGEIISADSRQVYKGLNLGTGKVTPKEMTGVRHHLLDVVSPKKVFNVSDYVVLGHKAIADILSRKKTPILCGGTGLYVDALLGRVTIPNVPPNPELRKKLEEKSAPQLFAILEKLDPKRAAEIDKHNPVRLIRAIEIVNALGRVPEANMTDSPYEHLFIGLILPQKELHARIHDRLLSRMKAGMLTEVEELHAKGLSWRRMEMLGLEYRYLARHLQGVLTKKEMLATLEQEIIRYSKRQMTWFKREENALWIHPKNAKKAISKIGALVSKKKS